MINLKDPAELRNAANNFDAKVSNIKDRIDNITKAYDRLFENWQDKNSADIQDTLAQVKNVSTQLLAKADTMKTVLNNEAAKAEEVQARISARHDNKTTIETRM